jgi:hypothetical protein
LLASLPSFHSSRLTLALRSFHVLSTCVRSSLSAQSLSFLLSR